MIAGFILGGLPVVFEQFAGSIGWVLDGRADSLQVLGTCFAFARLAVVTCAHVVAPYEEMPELLKVTFPALGMTFGVKEIIFQPEWDKWRARRLLNEAICFPPPGMSTQYQNMAVLMLTGFNAKLCREAANRVDKPFLGTVADASPGFSGKATNNELSSVIQTLVNARKVGTIVITDAARRPIGRLFCEHGRIRYATYRLFTNEEAIYRLIEFPFNGHFFFQELERAPEWCSFEEMQKSIATVLLEGYRRLEELNRIYQQFGGDNALIRKHGLDVSLTSLPAEMHGMAMDVWADIHDNMYVSRLLRTSPLDGYNVMTVLERLVSANQIAMVSRDQAVATATDIVSLPVAPQVPVGPGDDISILSLEPETRRFVVEPGKVLNYAQEGEGKQLLHSISVPPDAAGAPIFKGNAVVGIHCGSTTSNLAQLHTTRGVNQMLTSASILGCLPEIKNLEGLHEVTEASVVPPEPEQSLPEESEEETGLQPDIPEELFESQPEPSRGGIFGAVMSKISSRQPIDKFLELQCSKPQPDSGDWLPAAPGASFKQGEIVRVQIKVLHNTYVYAMRQATNGDATSLLFPNPDEKHLVIGKGELVSLPRRDPVDQRKTGGFGRGASRITELPGLAVTGGKGADTLIVFTSNMQANFLWDREMLDFVFKQAHEQLVSISPLQAHVVDDKTLGRGLFAQPTRGGGFLTLRKIVLS